MPQAKSSPTDRPLRHRALGAATLGLWLALSVSGCGGDVEARMAEVRALQDVGQFAASIEELRQVLAIAPDLPEATYRLGVALMQTGEPSRAVWALEKAAESEEFAIPASMLLATAHFHQQNYEAVVRSADRVLELDPERHGALKVRAQGNLGAGRFDEALADTERLLETQPDDYSVHALYATVLTDLGRMDEARTANEKLKEMALASGDATVEHRGCLAPALFARDYGDDPELTEELFDDCVERFPTNGLVAQESTRFYDEIGKSDKATALVERAVDEAPDNLSIRANLANRLGRLGDLEGAEKVLTDAVESFDSAGAWSLLAAFYRDQERPEAALEALEKVAEHSEGGTDQLRFTQADVLIDLGELDRAEKAAETLTQPTYASLLRGRIALERGDATRALELFEEGIRSWPNNPGARYLAGIAAHELGELDRAISELREAVRVDNKGTAAAELLARIHFDRGEYRESLQFGRMALQRPNANRPHILTLGVRALIELDEFDQARKTATALAQLEGSEYLAAAESAGIERAASGPDAAIESIRGSGLELGDPEGDELLRAYAENLSARGDNEVALAQIDRVLAAHPEHVAYHEMRGALLTRLGRDDEARAALEKAVELAPDHAASWSGLATLAGRAGEFPRAVELLDKAAKLSPNTPAYAYTGAQLARLAGDEADSERRLRDVVRRFPTHVGARNDLAWLLAERGDELDWALELAQEARRIEPSPEVLDTLGWVRLRRGEASAAVAALQEAHDARPDSPSICYRLGKALFEAGDPERARGTLQECVEAGPFPEAEEARRLLEQIDRA